jgi:spore coat protein U-like protein
MRRIAVVAFGLVLLASAAHAANCSWDQVPPNINFGTYSGGALAATSDFQFTCTPSVATATLKLSRGSAPSYTPRQMPHTTAPAATLDYNLYRDSAHTIIWGDGTGGTQYLTFNPAPGNRQFTGTIFGNLPAGSNVPTGTYTDTIAATLDSGSGVDTQFFTVTVNVVATCTVSTVALNFGAYDPVSANAVAPRDATGTVNVYCTAGTFVTVTLDNGLWVSGTNRRLKAVSFLTYEIYKDAARSIIWNVANTNTGTSTSNVIPINGGFTAYGRIFAGQDVPAGSYSDTILVTVNY